MDEREMENAAAGHLSAGKMNNSNECSHSTVQPDRKTPRAPHEPILGPVIWKHRHDNKEGFIKKVSSWNRFVISHSDWIVLTRSRRQGRPRLLLGFLLKLGSVSRSEVEKQLSVVGRKENRHHC